MRKTSPITPHDENLKLLHNTWTSLKFWQRKMLLIKCCLAALPIARPPVFFSLRASLGIFVLLAILPTEVLSVPTAIGGGLAFALMTH
jgi:hypothetical protein